MIYYIYNSIYNMYFSHILKEFIISRTNLFIILIICYNGIILHFNLKIS